MTGRWLTRAVGALAALSAVFAAADAEAFCRSRTCKDKPGYFCERRGTCIVEGHELFRTSSCTSYAVQRAGSRAHGVNRREFDALVREAFDRWLEADCGAGRRPSIDVVSLGAVRCDEVSYNKDSGNVSVFVFRDDWGLLDADAYALTTVFFETTTGEIYDADVEINATVPNLVTSSPEDGVDLGSILTHEVGHFLGLAHSQDPDAVMRPNYTPMKDDLRRLRSDDVAGICDIYPPGRKTESNQCLPRHGFARDCRFEPLEAGGGCAQAPGRTRPGLFAFGAAVAALWLRSRRRSARSAV